MITSYSVFCCQSIHQGKRSRWWSLRQDHSSFLQYTVSKLRNYYLRLLRAKLLKLQCLLELKTIESRRINKSALKWTLGSIHQLIYAVLMPPHGPSFAIAFCKRISKFPRVGRNGSNRGGGGPGSGVRGEGCSLNRLTGELLRLTRLLHRLTSYWSTLTAVLNSPPHWGQEPITCWGVISIIFLHKIACCIKGRGWGWKKRIRGKKNIGVGRGGVVFPEFSPSNPLPFIRLLRRLSFKCINITFDKSTYCIETSQTTLCSSCFRCTIL